jgi:hypothetical protein
MKWQWVLPVVAWIAMTASADAEFYKYRDNNGVLLFTDNLAEVPLNQRPGAQSYKEADDYLTPYQKKERAEKARRETEMAAKEAKQGSFEAQQEQRLILNNTRTALDKEYGELMHAKKALEKEKAQATTPEKQVAYKKRFDALNKRIIEYEDRRNQYEEAIKNFIATARAAQ